MRAKRSRASGLVPPGHNARGRLYEYEGGTTMGSKAGQARRGKKKAAKGVDLTTYTTRKGVVLNLLPVSQLKIQMIRGAVRDKFREAGEPIAVPTYSSTTVAGEVQEFPLDEKSLEVPGDAEETARRIELWTAHENAMERLRREQNNRATKEQFAKGIDIEVPDAWDAEMESLDIEIPEDPTERKFIYIVTEVLPTPDEWADVVIRLTAIANSATLTKEMLEAAEATFRNSLRE